MISLITGALGAAAKLGGSIFGAIKSKEYNDRANAILKQQREENKAWYNTKMAEDYTQRTDAQAVFNKQRELLDQQYNNAKASAAVTGASDAAVAAQKAAANDAMAQTMSDVASDAADYKNQVENSYRNTEANLANQEREILTNQAKGVADAAASLGDAASGLIGAGANLAKGIKETRNLANANDPKD